eukprot:3724969-Pleurochrysis_carterae.AAC.1
MPLAALAAIGFDRWAPAEVGPHRRRPASPGDMYVKALDEVQAADAAAALAKAIYGRMFDAIVSRINELIDRWSTWLLPDVPIRQADLRRTAEPGASLIP